MLKSQIPSISLGQTSSGSSRFVEEAIRDALRNLEHQQVLAQQASAQPTQRPPPPRRGPVEPVKTLPQVDRRTALRIPLSCPARIRTQEGATHYGTCRNLSVDGLCVQSTLVPRDNEGLEVVLLPPPGAGHISGAQPMRLQVRVRRCLLQADGRYELGLFTIQILG